MAPTSKRTKAAKATEESELPKRSARARKGKLEELPNMPLDILYEIFSHLAPLDILNLSRTTKAFCALLMDRSAVPFWKAARQNVPGLPEPFPGMSEPAFANLCFSPHCHCCLKRNIQEPIWEFRTRLCNACRKTSTKSCIPLLRSSFHLQEAGRLLPNIVADVVAKTENGSDDWVRGIPRVLKSDAEEVEAAWKAVPDSEEARTEFLKTHDRRFRDIEEHAELCRRWYQERKNDRSNELLHIRLERYDAIVAKLEDLGYGDDVEFSEEYLYDKNSLEYHPFVRQSKPLTERTWENNIADLMKFIDENITPRRVYHQYREDITDRLDLLRPAIGTIMLPKYRPFFPRMRDLVSFPEVRAMVDPFESIEFNSQHIDQLIAMMDDLFVTWEANCKRELDELIRAEVPDIPDDIDVSDLAIANIMRCAAGFCHRVFVDPWPNCFIHECDFERFFLDYEDRDLTETPFKKDDEEWYDLVMDELLGSKWSKKHVGPLAQDVSRVVRLCGKDPVRVSAAEMDELGMRFICDWRGRNSGVRKVLKWREAAAQQYIRSRLTHFGIYFPEDGGSEDLEVLPSQYVNKIASLELASEQRIEGADPMSTLWRCARCNHFCGLKTSMVAHVKAMHEIETPGDDDFFQNPEKVLKTSYPVYIVSACRKTAPLLPAVQMAFTDGRAAWESDIFGSDHE